MTLVGLGILVALVPRFTATDWIYVAQHLLVRASGVSPGLTRVLSAWLGV